MMVPKGLVSNEPVSTVNDMLATLQMTQHQIRHLQLLLLLDPSEFNFVPFKILYAGAPPISKNKLQSNPTMSRWQKLREILALLLYDREEAISSSFIEFNDVVST